jgi:hypothetical protein
MAPAPRRPEEGAVSICDFLFSADLCVPAAGEAFERLQTVLGLPQPGPAAYVRYADDGWDVIFALVNKAFAAAPTRLEIIAPLDPPGSGRPGRGVFDRQAPRLWRTHATVVATPSVEALAERAARAGARCWFQAPAPEVPFARLWMGAAAGDLADYDPGADGGFRFEFIPSDSPAFSAKLFQPPVDEPRPGELGLRRIRSRAFLVADINATLRRLEAVFDWAPAHPVRDEAQRGYRFVDMSANHAHGAALRLIQPVDADTPTGRDFAAQGPGPYAITLSAFDLEATAADLAARGVPHRRIAPGRWEPEAVIPDAALGAPIALTPDERLGGGA